jgi:FOG: TPR repeat
MLGLYGLALVIYAPAFHGEFLWDDAAHVTRLGLQGWNGLWRIWFEIGATQQYYPVLHTWFWLQHAIWGDSSFAYHLLNTVLHATNACLLAALLRRIRALPQNGPSSLLPAGAEWLAALLLVVHPVCVESVAWISEQKNTLSTAFYLLAASCYLGYAARRTWKTYAAGTAFFLLALGSKTVTATLPAALLVIVWWRQGRLQVRRDVVPLLSWFAAGIAAGLTTVWFERVWIGAEGAAYELSLVQRTLLAARILWFYLGKLIWPAELTFFYERWDVASEAVAWTPYLLGALAMTAALWLFRQRSRGPLAAWLLYAGSLFPALGFFNVFPFSFSYVADHFQYLASITMFSAAAVGFMMGLRRLSRPRQILFVAVALVVMATLGMISRRESAFYRDNETLFRANIARNPTSWMGHHILATTIRHAPERRDEAIALFRRAIELNASNADSRAALAAFLAEQPGHEAEAMALFEEALKIRPGYAEAHNGLANLLVEIPERVPEAINHYETAVRLRPRFGVAWANLARALARAPGREDEALQTFHEVLRLMPDHAPSHYHLANLLVSLGRPEAALSHYEHVLRLQPNTLEAHVGLGDALFRLKRPADAVPHWEAAIRLNPNSAELHAHLADALAELPGRLPDALKHYDIALRLNPRFPRVHYNVAARLAAIPTLQDDAREHVEEALRLQPDYPEALNLLGVIHAQNGREAEARDSWQRALELRPDYDAVRRNLQRLSQGAGSER